MPTERIIRLKQAVLKARPGICPERALIWTRYFKNRNNRPKSVPRQMAEALSAVLQEKSIRIFTDELIVGNYSSRRVGGSIFPELHGMVVMQDLMRFGRRRTSPLAVSASDRRRLMGIVPFWLFRFLGFKAHASLRETIRFILDQLNATTGFINESGGVAHLAPDYEKLVRIGTDGIVRQVNALAAGVPAGSDRWIFYQAVKTAAEGLARFGERYAKLACRMARQERDAARKADLIAIADVCSRVPRNGARTLHEALQSLFFAQIAINLESLDNAVSPGRMDQYLYPYYREDVASGRLTPAAAAELVAAFSVKMSEIVPVFSDRITAFHGGMFNGQVVTVGGTDAKGEDAVNPLSGIFLEVMDTLRMRQPNYHARVHGNAPADYLDKVFDILARGGGSPALYNDDVIVPTMTANGYRPADARNYTAVGCVEPVSQGKSFASTDAALFNLPLMVELALNRGRRFGGLRRIGAKTDPVSRMGSMADVRRAFGTQLAYAMERLIHDLQAVERANAAFHPTPLTSTLLDGCLQKGVCSTAGGAAYNFSGIQCVGPADTGDALYAVDRAVFREKRLTLDRLVDLLKRNLDDPAWLRYLRELNAYGNDHADADAWTVYALEAFAECLDGRINTRGGRYTAGAYSVTAHRYFGTVAAALPSGRKRGESFASGIAPRNGKDTHGPTAVLNSANRIDMTRMANGVNLNLKFSPAAVRGDTGRRALQALFKTYFRRGGMQAQVNVLDPAVLKAARKNPEAYPSLLVRVSGYSAYFNDLTPEMQDEIIERTCFMGSAM